MIVSLEAGAGKRGLDGPDAVWWIMAVHLRIARKSEIPQVLAVYILVAAVGDTAMLLVPRQTQARMAPSL